MDPKSITALIAIIISIISLYVSVNVAWISFFKPAELSCTFPHLVIWTLSSYKGEKPTGKVASRHIAPSLWLGNSGAKRILIEDIRLLFITNGGKRMPAYPMNKIPGEAIESPSIFHKYELLRLGGPFFGFSLDASDGWKSSYSFSMKEEYFHKLKEKISVEVQIIENKKKEWRSIHEETFDFGTHPIHLKSLDIGVGVGGALINHVFSENWNMRRKKTGL
ncbi:MAG: hypothetical protein SVY10_07350 [Thermodesulfobacteriota bacterium]|nr:hypothetical protein [Thermodesulfobacteriota bacterium]